MNTIKKMSVNSAGRAALNLGVLPLALGLAFAGGSAIAQTAPGPQATQGGDASASVTLDDIVVTANRTASLASKTPVALTAISGEQLQARGVTNPTQLNSSVPNLRIDRNNGLQVTIRGVTSTDNTEKGDTSAAFLLDGIYLARPQAQEVSFFDVERIEVLRGPQGTLYGRNTTAGVINLITATPKDTFSASVDGTLGNYSTRRVTGMVNVPVAEGVAIRAAGTYDRRDSFVINDGQSKYDFNPGKENYAGRLSALFDISPDASLVVRGDYSKFSGTQKVQVLVSNFFQSPFTAPPAGGAGADPVYIAGSSKDRRTQRYGDANAQALNQKNRGVQAQFDWKLAPELKFTYLGSYRYFTQHNRPAGFGGINPVTHVASVYPQTLDGEYKQNSQEARLAYANDRLSAQAGLYYFRERAEQASLSYGRITSDPNIRGYVFGYPGVTTSETVGVFGQATYSVLPTLRLTAGVRNTWDDKERVGATIRHIKVSDPLDFTTGPNATLNPNGYSDSLNNARVKYSKATWKVGVDYDLNAQSLLYATVSTGYKAGGFNDGCVAGTANCSSPIPAAALYYDPETLTAYELGVKTRVLDSRLSLNADYFHYDYSNLQLTQQANLCGTPCSVTTNAAKAKVDGVEVEGVYRVGGHGRLLFSGTWLKARYDSYLIVPTLDFAGRRLDRSPTWTGSIGYTHSVPLPDGGELAAGFRTFASTRYKLLSSALRAQFTQPGYTNTDLDLTYTSPDSRWYLQGFVRNVEDKVTLSSAAAFGPSATNSDGTATFGDPRTFGASFGVKF